jgi:hypothetical protein
MPLTQSLQSPRQSASRCVPGPTPTPQVAFALGRHYRFGASCLQGMPRTVTFALNWLPYTNPFLLGEKPPCHYIWCLVTGQDTTYSVIGFRAGLNGSDGFPIFYRCGNRLCRSHPSAQRRGWTRAGVRIKRVFSWRPHQNTPTVCVGSVHPSSIYVAVQIAADESDASTRICLSPKRVNMVGLGFPHPNHQKMVNKFTRLGDIQTPASVARMGSD